MTAAEVVAAHREALLAAHAAIDEALALEPEAAGENLPVIRRRLGDLGGLVAFLDLAFPPDRAP